MSFDKKAHIQRTKLWFFGVTLSPLLPGHGYFRQAHTAHAAQKYQRTTPLQH